MKALANELDILITQANKEFVPDIKRVFSKCFFHADLKNEVHLLLTPTVFLISFFRFFEILAKSTNFRKQIA